MSNIRFFIKSGAVALAVISLMGLFSCQTPQQADPPNVVIILADDLGYGDLGCYNAESLVPTPNLDRLATQGVRLTRAYCPVSVCSPTRYALMTGRYPWRSWRKTGVMRNYERSMIEADIMTLPEMLQRAGYRTAGFGKWHLGTLFPTLDGKKPAGYGQFRADDNGANLDLSKPVSDGPLDHGFDRWYGFSCASECWILDDNAVTGAIGHDLYTIEAAPNKEHIEVIPLADYLPHITAKTLDFLQQHNAKNDNQPFFLYFSPYVPHIPLAVSEAFKGKTKAGLYGDYVHELDYYIGKLLIALDSMNMADNTIVLFASDNGSQFELTSSEIDMTDAKNSPGSVGKTDELTYRHQPNRPLRGTKWSIYEGGVRTPFLARWPARFPAGKVSDKMIGLNDVIRTMAAVIDYDLAGGTAVDSRNVLPVLEGDDNEIREEIIVQSSGKLYGIIKGKWKYIGLGNYEPDGPDDPPGELYDLTVDETESENLYEQHPEVVQQLQNRLKNLLNDEVSFEE